MRQLHELSKEELIEVVQDYQEMVNELDARGRNRIVKKNFIADSNKPTSLCPAGPTAIRKDLYVMTWDEWMKDFNWHNRSWKTGRKKPVTKQQIIEAITKNHCVLDPKIMEKLLEQGADCK